MRAGRNNYILLLASENCSGSKRTLVRGMDYYFKPSALRDLRRLSKDVQKRILEKLAFYAAAEAPLDFAEPLKDKELGEYRFRIGEYRVIFDVAQRKIIVLAVGHRKEIYR